MATKPPNEHGRIDKSKAKETFRKELQQARRQQPRKR